MLVYSRRVELALLVSLVFVMLISSTERSSSAKEDEITAPKSMKPVKIGGTWGTKSDWSDASVTRIVENGLTAYVRLKHGEGSVYILVDFVSAKTLTPGNWGVVCFDTKGDGGKHPLADDYCFYRTIRGASSFASGVMQGNGMRWNIIQEGNVVPEFQAVMSHSQLDYPYESKYNRVVFKEHYVVYAFKIPMRSKDLDGMRFYLYVNDGYYNNFVEWPTNAGGKRFSVSSPTIKDVLATPGSWGSLHQKP